MSSPTTSKSSNATPLRAIPSSLAVKSSPSIPPPTQVYEPHLKVVLRQRLAYNIFAQSALLTWLVMVLSTAWNHSQTSSSLSSLALLPFNPLLIVGSFFVWVSLALPSIVIRKALLTPIRTPATSPATSLSTALLKASARHAIIAYMTCALIMVSIHTLIAYPMEKTDPKLRLFVNSKKHPLYLNGRVIFLATSQFAIACGYSIRSIMLDRFVFNWNIASRKDDFTTRLNILVLIKATIISAILSTLSIPLAAIIFASARLVLPIIYKLPVISSFLRPFTAHFLRGPWMILLPLKHVDILRRAWYLGFVTFFIWEVSDNLFELNVATQIPVSHLTVDPNQTLIAGISSSDTSFKYFAYAELRTLAEGKTNAITTQRTTLFADQKHNPTLWARLLRESLLLLGKDYQLFLRRGNPEPIAAPTPPPKPTLPDTLIPSSPLLLRHRSIYKSNSNGGSVLDHTLDAVASDGPGSIPKTVDAVVDGVDLPEIFRSTEPNKTKKIEKEVQKVSTPVAKTVVETIKQRVSDGSCVAFTKYAPIAVKEGLDSWLKWWRDERISKVVEKSLPLRELDILVVEVISHLTCASLTEDRYGVVQKDIPRILEAFLSFFTAVEEYQIYLNSLIDTSKPDDQLSSKELQDREVIRYEVEKAREVLGLLADGLKEGVARIVRTFGDKLFAFKFPPRTAQKLQGFLDYC